MQFLWVALLGAPIAAAASPPYQQQLPQQLPMSPALMSALEQAGQLRGSQIPPQTNLAGYPAQPPMQMPAQMPAQEAPLPQQAAPQQAAPQLQQQQQQAPPQQAPLDAAVEASVGLAADDSAAMEVKSAAPAAKKGSLPDMPALMGNSFETFGNLVFSLNTDADEVESQIHSLQQEETRRFAQRKAQLEQHLQEQRAATEALRVQVAQVEAQVEQLRRADEADTNKAEQLQDENQKLADQLRRSQAALGVAARRFQEHVAQDLNEMKNGLGAAEQESTAAALEATYPTQATQGAGTVAKADELSADELSADQPAQDVAAVQPAAAPVKAEKKKHHLLQKQHLVKSGAKSAAEAATKKVVGCNKKGCHIVSASMADELDDDEDEDEDQDQDGGSGYAADDVDEDADDDNDAPGYHYRAGASFLQAARSVHHARQPGTDALDNYRMPPSNPEGVLETLRLLTAKATSLVGIEKQADKSLQEAFDRAFAEGARHQNSAAEQLRRLTKQRNELQTLLAHRQASVKRLQAVHDHLQQDLAKVDASLQSVEHFGDTVATLASGR